MTLLDARREPSPLELRVFGLLAALALGLVGALVLWRTGSLPIAGAIWALGGIGTVVYYALPPLRRVMMRAWMAAVYPIGWTLSHLTLALIYYLIFTPIGWSMRLFGRDTMQRRSEAKADSYWAERRTKADVARYFKQF